MRIGVEGERLTVGPVDPQQEPDLAVRSTLGGVLAQLPFLANAVIDFTEELIGARFVIENPNASSSCGCGTSFSI